MSRAPVTAARAIVPATGPAGGAFAADRGARLRQAVHRDGDGRIGRGEAESAGAARFDRVVASPDGRADRAARRETV